MTISSIDANIQKVDMLQIGAAQANNQHATYRSTGSKLLDSLKHQNTINTTTALFCVDAANGLGLHHIEIPALNSAPATQACNRQKAEPTKTAREQAVARMANVIKQDRTSLIQR